MDKAVSTAVDFAVIGSPKAIIGGTWKVLLSCSYCEQQVQCHLTLAERLENSLRRLFPGSPEVSTDRLRRLIQLKKIKN